MFKIKVKHQEGEFAWDISGNSGDMIFGVQVKDKDKQSGIDMVKRSLVLNKEFGLKSKKDMETFMSWQNKGKDVDLDGLITKYTYVME